MNLRRLRYFLRTAAEGSLTKAARSSGIAQPALTRQIQLLEAEIGAQVFERTPRGLRLTDAGQFLKEALELPLSEIETALKSVRSNPMLVTASVTLGIPPSISGLFGARLVTRIRQELPNIALRVVERDSGRLAIDLSRRLIDVAILVAIPPDQRVSRTTVLSEPLLLVGAVKSPALDQASVALRELESLSLILPSAEAGVRIDLARAAAAADKKISPIMEIDSLTLTKQLVQNGEAYTILPERAFLEEAEAGTLRGVPIVEPSLSQPVWWAVKPDWRLPRAVYNELERVVFQEWFEIVASGEWPAQWALDMKVLSLPFCRKNTSINP